MTDELLRHKGTDVGRNDAVGLGGAGGHGSWSRGWYWRFQGRAGWRWQLGRPWWRVTAAAVKLRTHVEGGGRWKDARL